LGLPRMGMSATTFAIINMGIIALLLGLAPLITSGQGWAKVVAGVVAVIEIANGAGHLTAVVIFRGYVPGALTAPLLIIGGGALIRSLLRQSKAAESTTS